MECLNKYGLLSTMVLFVCTCYGQSSITGKVLIEKAPAVQGTVNLNGHSVLTDSLGHFSFSGLSSGKYVLEISMVGYETYHKNLTLKENETKDLVIEMLAAPSSLDAVVVTGTMKPIKRLESPIAVEVYSPQFFKKNPTPSIFESLQNVSGVRPQ